MEKNSLITVIAIIAVLAIGTIAATTFTQSTVTAAPADTATKLNFQNNGTNWLHMDLILENVTLKNGTVQTIYCELWVKPNSTLTVDLSNLLGYGTDPVPAGTNFRALSWLGLYDNNTNVTTGDLNLNIQGFSTAQPSANDTILKERFNGLTVKTPLPNGLNDSMFFSNTDVTKLHQMPGFIPDDDNNAQLYSEYLISVSQNGKVTITTPVPPELCELIAHQI